MNTKILAVAAAALAISAGAASAQSVNTSRQAGAALFDQGGVFNEDRTIVTDPATTASFDRSTTASVDQPRTIRSSVDNKTGVPSDTRNEGGLGLFDRVSK
jgi:long-subunit fatty acid transport protein